MISSIDGSTLMIGTETGWILSFDSPSGAATEYALPDAADGVVSRIKVFPGPFSAGSLPDNAFALVSGRIPRFNGLYWATTTGTSWNTFALDSKSDRLFAATDGDVFVSHWPAPILRASYNEIAPMSVCSALNRAGVLYPKLECGRCSL